MRSVLMTLAAGLVALTATAPARAGLPPYYEDAPLHAVQFVDRTEGWAAGAEGVVWHTIDGGATWERQPTGTRATLHALHFLTPYTGWAVGREELPRGAGSAGVVLFTADGGLKWEVLSANAVPGLHAVHFFDDRVGLAAGDGSDQHPGGVFRTDDGGRTWKALPGPRCPGWRAMDCSDPNTAALGGAWSRLAPMRNGALGTAEVDQLGGRSVRGLKLSGRRAVAVGDGGLILTSQDSAGVRWGFEDLGLPLEVRSVIDFRAVCAHRDHVWAVGRPGSVVLHSAGFGGKWEALATGQPLPLNGVFFLNDLQGWAVGELGVVLATEDGGRSWKVQRRGHQRAAVLCAHARAESIPFDAVALCGGDDGYLTIALQTVSADPAGAHPRHAAEGCKLAAAVRAAGGAAAEALWQFPLPRHFDSSTPAEQMAHWDALHGDQASEQWLRQLVLALRVWQPEVVVTDPAEGAAAGRLTAGAVREAFRRAADPNAYPEQIQTLGLAVWAPKKLYELGDSRPTDPVRIDPSEPRQRLGDTPREIASSAWGLFGDQAPAVPTVRSFRLVAATLPGAASHSRLLEGIALGVGGTARRELDPPGDAELAAFEGLQKALRTRRAMDSVAAGGVGNPDQLMAQIPAMLKELPSEQGAKAAYAIADRFAKTGQWHLAREAFFVMVDRYPADPLAADAYRWLVRYHASGEARRRQELGQFVVITETTVQPAHYVTDPTKGVKLPSGVEPVKHERLAYLSDRAEARRWYEGSLEVQPRLAAFGPLFAGDPAINLCLNASRRQLGKLEEATKWCQRYMATAPNAAGDPWREAVAAELWLSNRTTPPPKSTAPCRQAALRPFLDGKLDDDCWQKSQPLVLSETVGRAAKGGGKTWSPPAEYETKAWLTYDAEYVYFAVQCRHPADRQVPPAAKRVRDADLSGADRVCLTLDLDRDYQTYYQFQIDQSGRLAEDCWGDSKWDPKWFVAHKSGPDGWTAEVAIPMSELTGEPVHLGKTWAANVVRVLPGRGVQGWSMPADVTPRPEGMGLITFAQEAR